MYFFKLYFTISVRAFKSDTLLNCLNKTLTSEEINEIVLKTYDLYIKYQ